MRCLRPLVLLTILAACGADGAPVVPAADNRPEVGSPSAVLSGTASIGVTGSM